jgi:hypothetical protein
MSQIERIKLALEQNPELIIFNIENIDRKNDLHKLIYTDISRVTTFNIIPKIGFEINDNLATNLQNFMNCLKLNEEPYKIDNFSQERIKVIREGKEKEIIFLKTGGLYFNETVPGERETSIRLQEREFNRVDKVNFIEQAIITPLPNIETAEKYRFTSYMAYIHFDLG